MLLELQKMPKLLALKFKNRKNSYRYGDREKQCGVYQQSLHNSVYVMWICVDV